MPNNLKRIRESKGITQTELAKRLGVSVQHLNRMENFKNGNKNSRSLSPRLAIKAAEILGCTLNDIFLPSNCPNRTNDNEE